MNDAPTLFTSWTNDPETGEALIVEHDREYRRILQEFHARECKHEDKEVRRVKLSNGSIQVRDCCVSCGSAVGLAKRQTDKAWVATLPWADVELIDSYESRRKAELDSLILDLARRQGAARGRFTKAYSEYLKSDAWKAKRALVLKRCGGVCEGCGVVPATEVHHCHYDHLFNEFLFELLGLCHDCHDRLTKENRKRLGVSEGDDEGESENWADEDVEF